MSTKNKKLQATAQLFYFIIMGQWVTGMGDLLTHWPISISAIDQHWSSRTSGQTPLADQLNIDSWLKSPSPTPPTATASTDKPPKPVGD